MDHKDRNFFEHDIMGTYPYLLRLITTISKDPALASDIVQDTMETAWKKIERIKGYSDLEKALAAIAKNKLFSYYRRHKDEIWAVPLSEEKDCPVPEADSAALLLEKEERRQLLMHVELLREDHARILLMHYYYEMPFREIAHILNVNYNTIVSWHRRALTKLKEIYKKIE